MFHVLFKTGATSSALSDIKHEYAAARVSFISDKARPASVLSGLKNDPSYEFTGEVNLKINII